jgi:hypothetical protein
MQQAPLVYACVIDLVYLCIGIFYVNSCIVELWREELKEKKISLYGVSASEIFSNFSFTEDLDVIKCFRDHIASSPGMRFGADVEKPLFALCRTIYATVQNLLYPRPRSPSRYTPKSDRIVDGMHL